MVITVLYQLYLGVSILLLVSIQMPFESALTNLFGSIPLLLYALWMVPGIWILLRPHSRLLTPYIAFLAGMLPALILLSRLPKPIV